MFGKKKYLVALLLALMGLFSFKISPTSSEQIIFERINYIFNLKAEIDTQVWKGFNNKQFDVPLIYYTDSSSYVANPTPRFLEKFKTVLVFANQKIKIYKTEKRVNSTPFHMETDIVSGDDASNEYNYNSPFMNCSSFEETAKKLPETHSTEYWTTMIIHEYFHGFQFQHKKFRMYVLDNITSVSEDSLKYIYTTEKWFKQRVDKENGFLLKAIEATQQNEIKQNIDSFFVAREARRIETKQKLQLDIENYEKTYETMEGTARYIEYRLQTIFANLPPDKKLMKIDSSFKRYKEFKNYNIRNDAYLFTTKKNYFYATGFNLVRLLDKLGIAYKTKLFNDEKLSLEALLKINYQRI